MLMIVHVDISEEEKEGDSETELIIYPLNWVLLQQRPMRRPLQHQRQKSQVKKISFLIQQSDRKLMLPQKENIPLLQQSLLKRQNLKQ